ncbi:MAG: ATP-dependent Clp protease proteolytic subunit [Clostridia bacterium]|nr:ATP-dependent Clp protease proteolytic subunit [Clostridia bacterium]
MRIKFNGKDTIVDEKTYELLEKRTIFIDGPINATMASRVIADIEWLSLIPAPIRVVINSPGGSVSDGFAIIDAMESSPCEIITMATGIAASMAAVILAAGNKRYATPRTEIMIHQPFGGASGQADDLMIVANHIIQIQHEVALFLAEKTGKSEEMILSAMSRDNWMNAAIAKEFNIIDFVGRG